MSRQREPDWDDGIHPFLHDEEVVPATLKWQKKKVEFESLDKKIQISLKIISRLLAEERIFEKNKELYFDAIRSIDLAYKWAMNQDFFAETQEERYQKQAEYASEKLQDICRKQFGENFAYELNMTEKGLLKFFNYEFCLWSEIKQGKIPTDDEIRLYQNLRGSDAQKYHAKIIKAFTGKDFSKPLHVWMQLFDAKRDYSDLERDLKNQMPNILVMYFLQAAEGKSIGDIKPEEVLRSWYVCLRIAELRHDLVGEISSFEFGKSGFLKEEIENLR